MNAENGDAKGKGRKILGWGLAVFGSLCTVLVILSLIVFKVALSIEYGCEDGVCFGLIFISLPLLVIGVPSLIFGIGIIRRDGKERSKIFGWVLLIFGIYFIILDLIIIDVETSLAGYWPLFFGILLILSGIWLINRKGKKPSLNPGSPYDLPGEKKNEHRK